MNISQVNHTAKYNNAPKMKNVSSSVSFGMALDSGDIMGILSGSQKDELTKAMPKLQALAKETLIKLRIMPDELTHSPSFNNLELEFLRLPVSKKGFFNKLFKRMSEPEYICREATEVESLTQKRLEEAAERGKTLFMRITGN